jgi:VCBS repeat-containing protein
MRFAARFPVAATAAVLILSSLVVVPVAAASPPDAVDDGTALAPFQFFPEDAPATAVDVIANDTGPDGLTSTGLTITGKTDGAHGTVAIDAGMRFVRYTPTPEDSGADSFTYTVSDGSTTDTATVYVSINALNDAPSFTLGPNQTVAEDSGGHTVTGFAVGSVGPPIESAQKLNYVIDGDTNPALFSVQPAFSPADAWTEDMSYTPAPNANGSATITVHAVDNGPNGGGDVNFSPTKTFTITVTPVNDAPVAVADGPFLVKQGYSVTRNAAGGVLANDTDIDTAHGSLTAVRDADVAHGALTLNADGSFTYTPLLAYTGSDSFTYHARDGFLNSGIVTVTLTVYVNHAPTAVDDSGVIVAGSPFVPLNVLANDNAANPDPGETLTVTSVTNASHGSVAITGGGTGLSYRPAPGFIGSDAFTYTISDGVFSATATVRLTIPKDTYKPVASAPVQTIPGQVVGTSTVVLRLTWTGADLGSGVSKFEIWQSTNGHKYIKIKTTSGHTMTVSVKTGSTYAFRVRAIDKKGNVGRFAYQPAFRVLRFQEGSATYSSPWTLATAKVYDGGKDRWTNAAGFAATFTKTERTVSWVTVRGPIRSTADVYVDGILRAHVSLTASTTAYRVVAFSMTFPTRASHTLRIVYTGPLGARIDVDAFVVLK